MFSQCSALHSRLFANPILRGDLSGPLSSIHMYFCSFPGSINSLNSSFRVIHSIYDGVFERDVYEGNSLLGGPRLSRFLSASRYDSSFLFFESSLSSSGNLSPYFMKYAFTVLTNLSALSKGSTIVFGLFTSRK
ncbi:uncharacterized protein G2W53_041073 [Senna tora]|uniref:Uncharacterized protein n=1 Tax=Senna tora TaxID=362788 RepID=A0A834SJD1_9FABA|nr:uncharacterized protein G2W53_041073 [Senna tora]